jgi:hypothetical protein
VMEAKRSTTSPLCGGRSSVRSYDLERLRSRDLAALDQNL